MPRLHCSLLTLPADLPLTERLTRIAQAGFDGVQVPLPLVASGRPDFSATVAESGLALSGCAHLPEDLPAEPLFEHAAAAGMTSLNAQVDGYWRNDSWQDARIRELLTLSEQYALPFFLETHRHRLTQDLRRTLGLLDRHPDLLLCGDFSHYTVTAELRAPWPPYWAEALHTLARRCGELHLRLNNGQNVQAPVPTIDAAQRAEFHALWSTALDSTPDLLLTTELLPAAFGYDQLDLDGAPIGDIWTDTLDLIARAPHIRTVTDRTHRDTDAHLPGGLQADS
ncbi:sugar phosphate isomerase/epimerase family protein [Streptomyces sp. NPDC056361]|uniref:sugar phosphate isomerase/epimerase family protein n=1 Tax=Streptomyces sp. NPDC056361 TaxID=3345795 RepID=UPI0035D5BC71